MSSPETLDPELVRTVRSLAADVVAAGRARLEVRAAGRPDGAPAGFALTPSEPEACAVRVDVEVPGRAHVELGRHGTVLDVWDAGESGAVRDVVAEVVRAALAGAYEEWVKVDAAGRPRATFGLLHTDGGDRTVLTNTWPWRRRPGAGWTHVRYAPYAG
jgi:hypothetical protein